MTAQQIEEQLDPRPELQLIPGLYHAGEDEIPDTLQRVDSSHERTMIVAHNPGQEDFLQAITGKSERLPTAALAVIRWSGTWSEMVLEPLGELENVWRPREIFGTES